MAAVSEHGTESSMAWVNSDPIHTKRNSRDEIREHNDDSQNK